MSIEDIKEAIEVLEDASAEMLMETGDKDYYSEAIAVLRQAVKQADQKTAASPNAGKGFIGGAWHCQCGKSYEVTCISSKPPKKEWVGLTGDEVNEFAAGCHLGNSVQGAIRKAETKLKEKNT